MQYKKFKYILAFGATSSFLYVKYLLSIRLCTSKKQAVYNGFQLLHATKGRVLAITAHPDDLEVFVGATLKLLHDRDLELYIVDVSDGEKGVKRKNLAHTRQAEQLNAGKVLGIDHVIFGHLPDLHLKNANNLEGFLKECIEKIMPDTVFAFDYKYPFRIIRHPDHIVVGRVTEKIIKAMNKNISLVFYATRKPNAIVEISSAMKDKIIAIKQHKSQLRFGPQPYSYLTRMFTRYIAKKTLAQYVEAFRMSTCDSKSSNRKYIDKNSS